MFYLVLTLNQNWEVGEISPSKVYNLEVAGKPRWFGDILVFRYFPNLDCLGVQSRPE